MRVIASLIHYLLQIYLWIVIIRAVLSWVQPNPGNPLVRFIYNLVDPVTYRISKVIPTRLGAVDMAPMILIVLIVLLRSLVARALVGASVPF